MTWRAPVDLDNCAEEPIHVPGAIQPHGALIAVTEPDLRIGVVSGNLREWFGADPDEVIGRPLGDVIGEDNRAAVERARELDWVQRYDEIALVVDGRPCLGTLHRSGPYLVVEVEPHDGDDRHIGLVREAAMGLQTSRTVVEVADQAARWIRSLSGFDRVMVYRFDSEWNGEVIAENKAASLNTFLGLHYPATDIPAQARELYRRNWLRLIPDIAYVPVPLVPPVAFDTARPLDLSGSTLRSVSPIHVEYLSNMGVGASMSVSILVNGELWGLIACHHYSGAHRPNVTARNAAEFLAQLISLRIADAIEVDTRHETIELNTRADAVAEAFAETGLWDFEAVVRDREPDVLALADATGVLISAGELDIRLGEVPADDAVRAIRAVWSADTDVLRIEHLAEVCPSAASATASGVLAMALSSDRRDFAMWFRPEIVQRVDWGGDPHNAKLASSEGDHVRLSPRKSFDLWRETIRGKSAPWRDAQIRAARRFTRHLGAALLRRERDSAALAEDLQRAMRPPALPQVPGLRFDAFYETSGSGGIGGDWYDAFSVDDHLVAAVIGDVAGHGLQAASEMTQLRNSLRAYLVGNPDPAGALEQLDQMMHSLLPGSIATVVCVVIDTRDYVMQIAHAGHPPALLVRGDSAEFLELASDPLLGLTPSRARHSVAVPLHRGERLVLYSDGLIESRRRSLDIGMERLRTAAMAVDDDDLAAGAAEQLAATLIGPDHEDDVTTLVIQRTAGEPPVA